MSPRRSSGGIDARFVAVDEAPLEVVRIPAEHFTGVKDLVAAISNFIDGRDDRCGRSSGVGAVILPGDIVTFVPSIRRDKLSAYCTVRMTHGVHVDVIAPRCVCDGVNYAA